MANTASSLRSALYCSFWDSAVFSAVRALLAYKGQFYTLKKKSRFLILSALILNILKGW